MNTYQDVLAQKEIIYIHTQIYIYLVTDKNIQKGRNPFSAILSCPLVHTLYNNAKSNDYTVHF